MAAEKKKRRKQKAQERKIEENNENWSDCDGSDIENEDALFMQVLDTLGMAAAVWLSYSREFSKNYYIIMRLQTIAPLRNLMMGILENSLNLWNVE